MKKQENNLVDNSILRYDKSGYICTMDFKLEIFVPRTRSPILKDVIRAAEKTGCYDNESRKLTFHDIRQVFHYFEQFAFVLFNSQKWAGFYVTFNDTIVVPWSNNLFYHIQDVKECHNCYKRNEYEEGYCSYNGFGCRNLHSISRYIDNSNWMYNQWYRFGKFQSDKIWLLDKLMIANTLLTEAYNNFSMFCPEFLKYRIINNVNLLPDHLEINEFWHIEYRMDHNSTGPIYIPASICHNANYHNNPYPVKPPEEEHGNDNKDFKDMTRKEIDEWLDNYLKQKKRE